MELKDLIEEILAGRPVKLAVYKKKEVLPSYTTDFRRDSIVSVLQKMSEEDIKQFRAKVRSGLHEADRLLQSVHQCSGAGQVKFTVSKKNYELMTKEYSAWCRLSNAVDALWHRLQKFDGVTI